MTAAIVAAAAVVAVLATVLVRRCRRARADWARVDRVRVRLVRAEAETVARQRAVSMALEARAQLALAAWRQSRVRLRQATAVGECS